MGFYAEFTRIFLRLQYLYFLSISLRAARTPLPCRFGCSSPSTETIPTIDSNQSPQLHTSVNWKGCESIYVMCPSGYVVATYNSFTDSLRIYNSSQQTIYCGNDHNYYIFYPNEKQICSNSFDTINCIGLCRD
jgi:hypothetical protein